MNDTDYLPLPWEQIRELQQAILKRDEAIVTFVLQVPDYPPLPACPECGINPRDIASRVADPAFMEPFDTVLLRFQPCGHRFKSTGDPYA